MIYLELEETDLFKVLKQIVFPLAACFLAELVYRDAMLEFSKDSVPEMQDDFDNDGPNQFQETIVWLGSIKVLLVLLTVAFMCMDKASSMYLWSMSILVYYSANILESLYAQQRLYMMTDDVKTTLCYTGFGNPSDEAALNCFIHVSLFLHANNKDLSSVMKGPLLRRIITFTWPVAGVAFLGTQMFAQVMQGVNAFN
jgi:hypothetical protein